MAVGTNTINISSWEHFLKNWWVAWCFSSCQSDSGRGGERQICGNLWNEPGVHLEKAISYKCHALAILFRQTNRVWIFYIFQVLTYDLRSEWRATIGAWHMCTTILITKKPVVEKSVPKNLLQTLHAWTWQHAMQPTSRGGPTAFLPFSSSTALHIPPPPYLTFPSCGGVALHRLTAAGNFYLSHSFFPWGTGFPLCVVLAKLRRLLASRMTIFLTASDSRVWTLGRLVQSVIICAVTRVLQDLEVSDLRSCFQSEYWGQEPHGPWKMCSFVFNIAASWVQIWGNFCTTLLWHDMRFSTCPQFETCRVP